VRRAAVGLRRAIRARADQHAGAAHACHACARRCHHFAARNRPTSGACSNNNRGFFSARYYSRTLP